MLQLILNWLGGPIVSAGIEAYKARITAENDADARTTELAGKALLLDQREAELRSQERVALIGHWSEPVNLLGYIAVLHFGLIVITNALDGFGIASFAIAQIKGDAGQWLGMVMTFFVGTRGAVSVAAILRRR